MKMKIFLVTLIILLVNFQSALSMDSYSWFSDINDSKYLLNLNSSAQDDWQEFSCKEKLLTYERLLILNNYQVIKKGIYDYYGEIRQFDNAKIIDVKPSGLNYALTIQFITFVGPHNPPLGKDTIVILLSTSEQTKILSYEHEDYR